jgi:Ca-activated chloride channel family protein
MTFDWPLALWGLLLVPVVLVAYLVLQRRRMRYAVRFTNLDLLANVVDRSPRWRRHVPAALFLAALAALLVGVARPQAVVKTPEEQATVVLAMDVSTSMEATDVEPTRLAAAKQAADTFLDQVPDEMRVGLVTFSNGAQVVVPPTAEHEQVREALSALVPDGGTAIGDAIAAAVRLQSSGNGAELAALGTDQSESDGAPLVVLLLSDGAPSPDTLDPAQAAEEAKAQGVKVYTVALGTDQGTVTLTDPFGNEEVVPVPPDKETLSQIAEITGGETFAAPTEAALQQVYEGLGSDIGFKNEKTDITFAFAAGGALLLLAGGLLSVAWFNRLP